MAAKVSMQPREPSLISHQVCSTIFVNSPLKSDQTKFTYSTTNDYGRKIHELFFSGPRENFSRHYFQNIQEIGDIEGFKVVASLSIYPVRDPKLRAADEKILEPTCTEALDQAIQRCIKRSKWLKNHAGYLTENPSVKEMGIGLVAHHKLHRKSVDGIQEENLRESRLYFEGGDSMHLTNKEGIPRFIFGEDLSIITHQALRINKWFSPPEPENESYFVERQIFSKYNDKITPQYTCGGIAEKMIEMTSHISKILTDTEVKSTLEEMKAMRLQSTVESSGPEEKQKLREIASKYLAQLKYVKEHLFPAELRCETDQVIFSPQIAPHLDMLMAAGPKGSIFLQDFDLSVQLLQTITTNAEKFGLSIEDLEQLNLLFKTTMQLGEDLQPLFQKTKKLYEDAGYLVIPTPGAFYGYREGKPYNINFFNCIPGYSDKTGHFFRIIPGANGNVGEILMDSHVEFLRSQSNKIAAYFVGRNPSNAKDFSEAVGMLNQQNAQLGPHCLSFELKISPHTTQTT